MAHIPDGVLSVPVLLGGAVVAGAVLVWSMRSLDEDNLPKVAVLAALFFVASLISIPAGPSSVHLLLSGLLGLLLGWQAMPAVFVALALQALFFGFGGLATLGVNAANIALPGMFWAMVLAPAMRRASSPGWSAVIGAAVAALSVSSTAALVVTVLVLSDHAYRDAAKLTLLAYLPLIIMETIIAGMACGFLARVRPELFGSLRQGASHA